MELGILLVVLVVCTFLIGYCAGALRENARYGRKLDELKKETDARFDQLRDKWGLHE